MCKKIERVILFLIVFLHVEMIQATSQIRTVHLQDFEIFTEIIERMLTILERLVDPIIGYVSK